MVEGLQWVQDNTSAFDCTVQCLRNKPKVVEVTGVVRWSREWPQRELNLH